MEILLDNPAGLGDGCSHLFRENQLPSTRTNADTKDDDNKHHIKLRLEPIQVQGADSAKQAVRSLPDRLRYIADSLQVRIAEMEKLANMHTPPPEATSTPDREPCESGIKDHTSQLPIWNFWQQQSEAKDTWDQAWGPEVAATTSAPESAPESPTDGYWSGENMATSPASSTDGCWPDETAKSLTLAREESTDEAWSVKATAATTPTLPSDVVWPLKHLAAATWRTPRSKAHYIDWNIA